MNIPSMSMYNLFHNHDDQIEFLTKHERLKLNAVANLRQLIITVVPHGSSRAP
jgi:hypothetical protein